MAPAVATFATARKLATLIFRMLRYGHDYESFTFSRQGAPRFAVRPRWWPGRPGEVDSHRFLP